jgi:hypothetical protein
VLLRSTESDISFLKKTNVRWAVTVAIRETGMFAGLF